MKYLSWYLCDKAFLYMLLRKKINFINNRMIIHVVLKWDKVLSKCGTVSRALYNMAWYALFCLTMGPFKAEVPVFCQIMAR